MAEGQDREGGAGRGTGGSADKEAGVGRSWEASEPLRAGDILAEGEVQPIEEAEVLRLQREEGVGERHHEIGGVDIGGIEAGTAGAEGAAAAPESPEDRLRDLERRLAAAHQSLHRAEREADTLREELKSARDQAARAMADLDNWRKRYARDLDREVLEQKKAVILALLPVVDNLERALSAARSQDTESRSAEALFKGVEMVLTMAHDALRRLGVTRIEAQGVPFDPTFHEAMGTRGEDPAMAGHVVEVIEPGYLIGQEVLRPARVLVGGTPTEMATSTAQTPYEGP